MNLFKRLYLLACNQFAGPSTALAYGLAANIDAEAISKSEWTKLTPYVDGDYWEQQNGNWKKYRQVVTREHGQRLVDAFNAFAAKRGSDFRGLPIYSGHPDVDPKRWPDERRLGGVVGIEAREDGIYVKTAWNDLGQKNLDEGYLVYPSPVWPYDVRIAAQTGRIEPVELRSVGMTNTPRIAGVPAWTNSDPTLNPQPTQSDTMIKTLLLKILGLPETATDEEITKAGEAFTAKAKTDADNAATAANALETEKQKAVAACSERDTAKADAEKFRKLAINAHVSAAITSGKITSAEQAGFETKLASNFDDGVAELNGRKSNLPNDPLRITQRTGDLSTPAGRAVAFNTAVSAHMAKGLGFNQAIEAMRANSEEAALLDAMQPAKS